MKGRKNQQRKIFGRKKKMERIFRRETRKEKKRIGIEEIKKGKGYMEVYKKKRR